jgi:hypothetical protein
MKSWLLLGLFVTKLLLRTVLLLTALLLARIEYRDFYCLNATEQVTVWRWFKGKVYIIPGRYYGLLPPTSYYIESPEANDVTIFFADALPHTLVVRTDRATLHLNTPDTSTEKLFNIRPYSQATTYYERLFYQPHAVYANDLNPHVRYIAVHLYDIYATDNNGTRL